MTTAGNVCLGCGAPIDGASGLCIACYRQRHVPCSACMVLTLAGWRPKRTGRGELRGPVDCPACGNERYVILDDVPPGTRHS